MRKAAVPIIGPRAVRGYELNDVAVAPIAKLEFVLYADMVFEGSASAREKIFGDRERLADEYAYWIAALEEARAKPASSRKAFLEERHKLRQADLATASARPSSSVGKSALNVVGLVERDPDALAAIDRRLEHMRARREVLLRHRR